MNDLMDDGYYLSVIPNQKEWAKAVGKTINLAKQGSYQIPRKPPLNTLIFEKLPEPRCGDKVTCGIKNPPFTKPVRICTKEDMQTFYCPPPPCDCKVKPPPLTFAQKIQLVLKNLAKAMVVSGIIYFTYKEGLWSDGFKSSCIIGHFVEKCPPDDEEDRFNEFADITLVEITEPEPCYPFIPSTSLMMYKAGQSWNKFVIFTFWLIMDAPSYFYNKFTERVIKGRKRKPPEICIT